MSRRDEFLRTEKILRLATIGRDSMPHIVPVWYRYVGKKFQIGTNTRTQKARNIRGNNRVSFCVDAGVNAPGIYGVMGRGRARLITEEREVRRMAKRILLRYFDGMNESAKELLDETDCIIEIVPENISVWNY